MIIVMYFNIIKERKKKEVKMCIVFEEWVYINFMVMIDFF